jgi:5-formyltetrahydrofolate cyclo-ligase
MTDKQALRTALRAARAAAPRAPVVVPRAFLDRLAPGMIVATYVPIGGEADPAPLARAALAAGARLALPHVVDRATPLRFLAWAEEIALAEGPFGLRQPAPHHDEIAPAVILTPLVGFDRRGNRVGQGAGHYDRAFAAHPDAWRVGVALAGQETAPLTPDPWDMPLHAIATEKEWIVPS